MALIQNSLNIFEMYNPLCYITVKVSFSDWYKLQLTFKNALFCLCVTMCNLYRLPCSVSQHCWQSTLISSSHIDKGDPSSEAIEDFSVCCLPVEACRISLCPCSVPLPSALSHCCPDLVNSQEAFASWEVSGYGRSKAGNTVQPMAQRNSAREHRYTNYTKAMLRTQSPIVPPFICKPTLLQKSQHFSTSVCTRSFLWLTLSLPDVCHFNFLHSYSLGNARVQPRVLYMAEVMVRTLVNNLELTGKRVSLRGCLHCVGRWAREGKPSWLSWCSKAEVHSGYCHSLDRASWTVSRVERLSWSQIWKEASELGCVHLFLFTIDCGCEASRWSSSFLDSKEIMDSNLGLWDEIVSTPIAHPNFFLPSAII